MPPISIIGFQATFYVRARINLYLRISKENSRISTYLNEDKPSAREWDKEIQFLLITRNRIVALISIDKLITTIADFLTSSPKTSSTKVIRIYRLYFQLRTILQSTILTRILGIKPYKLQRQRLSVALGLIGNLLISRKIART